MKKILKKVIVFLMLIGIVTVFAGCGNEEEKKNPSVSDKETENNKQDEDMENQDDAENKEDGKNQEDSKEDDKDSVRLAKETDKELSPYLVRAQAHGTDLYGYVDIRTGEMVIAPQFLKRSDASFGEDGWARVQLPDQSYMIVNTKGEYFALPEEFADGEIYDNGAIVVLNEDETKALLYHDAEFVKELELPEGCNRWVRVTECAGEGSGKGSSKYTPSTAIAISILDEEDENAVVWYDFDGNYLYTGKPLGSLAVEADKLYYFDDGKLTIMDKAGNELEEIDIWSRFSMIYVEDDNWYIVVIPSSGQYRNRAVLYTNGFTEVFPAKNTWETWASLFMSDDRIAISGVYYKEDGTEIYDMNFSATKGFYGYSNGYVKINDYTEGKYGFMDTEGNFVIDVTKEELEKYGSEVYPGGLLPYEEYGLWGVKDMQGNVVWEPAYPSLGE